MVANPYPSYLEMRPHLPVWAWQILRAALVACAFALIVVVFVDPRRGLRFWWLDVLPVLPFVFLLAPGIWRNVCPMATLNQVPRLFGFSRGLTVPRGLARHAILIQATAYVALISTRAPWLDHNGPAVGSLMLISLGSAFLGGLVFKGKSGWCGTFCPLMPIQRLYGQTPAAVVANTHCSTCVGCTTNCLDFNPRLAVIADVHEGEPYRVGQLKVFAGTFPGFVLAFFTVPHSVVAAHADLGVSLARYYGLTLVYMLVSLGVFFLLDALLPVSSLVLMTLAAAVALNIQNVLRFSTTFGVKKPHWVSVLEFVVVGVISVWFVARTFVHERRVAAFESDDRVVVLPRAAAAGSSSGAQEAEVHFSPDGPRIVVVTGSTLLEAAERFELRVESGCRMGVCGADPIAVLSGGDRLSPPSAGERSTLERLGLGAECRMACSARLLGDVNVSFDLSSVVPAGPVRIDVDYDRTVEHVVIVGNGIAGNTAADHVRRRHPHCTIDIVGEELHPVYNRMGISRLVYGRSAMAGLQLLGDDWYERNSVTPWLNTLVNEIDRDARHVLLGTGERLPYDRMILAMGASASVPPLDGLDRRDVFVMRTADDAIGIRAHAQRARARRAIVVGGGLLGLEAAYALHRFGLRVTVVQHSERLLERQLDERGSALLERYFTGLGIGVLLGVTPASVRDHDGKPALVLADGRLVGADIFVVCTGIRPQIELARAAGLDVGRGVIVDEYLRTSDPSIYAAGDIAEFGGAIYGLWPVAVAQAEVAAANVVGDVRRYEPQPPVTILKGVGLSVQAIGEIEGTEGDEVDVREPSEDDIRYAKVVSRGGIPVGALMIGDWPDAAETIDAVASGRPV